jgi:hypothetical protein
MRFASPHRLRPQVFSTSRRLLPPRTCWPCFVPDPLLGLCPSELCSPRGAVRRLRRLYPLDVVCHPIWTPQPAAFCGAPKRAAFHRWGCASWTRDRNRRLMQHIVAATSESNRRNARSPKTAPDPSLSRCSAEAGRRVRDLASPPQSSPAAHHLTHTEARARRCPPSVNSRTPKRTRDNTPGASSQTPKRKRGSTRTPAHQRRNVGSPAPKHRSPCATPAACSALSRRSAPKRGPPRQPLSNAAPKRCAFRRPPQRPAGHPPPKRRDFHRPPRPSRPNATPKRRAAAASQAAQRRSSVLPADETDGAEAPSAPTGRCPATRKRHRSAANLPPSCKATPTSSKGCRNNPTPWPTPPWRCPGTSHASIGSTWRKTSPAFPRSGRSRNAKTRANCGVPGDILAFRVLLPARIRSPEAGVLRRQQARSSPGLHTLQGSLPRHVGTAFTPCLPSWASTAKGPKTLVGLPSRVSA